VSARYPNERGEPCRKRGIKKQILMRSQRTESASLSPKDETQPSTTVEGIASGFAKGDDRPALGRYGVGDGFSQLRSTSSLMVTSEEIQP